MYTLQQSFYRREAPFQTFQKVTLIEKQHLLACDYGIQADYLLYWQNEDDCRKEKLPIFPANIPVFDKIFFKCNVGVCQRDLALMQSMILHCQH